MHLSKVLFIGGKPKQASAQIRCLDIARALGCNIQFKVRRADQIPHRYLVYVCVKSYLSERELLRLSKRGVVIWDVIDCLPPEYGVSLYLVSTEAAKQYLGNNYVTKVIRHHHCNKNGALSFSFNKRPAWLGHRKYWYPKLDGLEHDVYDVGQMSQREIIKLYLKMGISLNIRTEKYKNSVHVKLNSGIKLINCIGFGIPSISNEEPAYQEIGDGCTIFSDVGHCNEWVQRLQNDALLYTHLRQACIAKAEQYHISTIAEQYKRLFESL